MYDEDVPTATPALLELDVPILGVCYGMQLLGQLAGAQVERAGRREYGRASLEITATDGLFEGFETGDKTTVWMSHGDHLTEPPPGYEA